MVNSNIKKNIFGVFFLNNKIVPETLLVSLAAFLFAQLKWSLLKYLFLNSRNWSGI